MYNDDTAKTYTGTKTLKAWPATRGEYNQYRGWLSPPDEDPAENGYIVEYEEGGNPNHPDHKGYISWSPASVFERTYFETPGDWKSRLTQEVGQVEFRLDKLEEFVATSPAFEAMADEERELLMMQRTAMQSYSGILQRRLQLATPQPTPEAPEPVPSAGPAPVADPVPSAKPDAVVDPQSGE